MHRSSAYRRGERAIAQLLREGEDAADENHNGFEDNNDNQNNPNLIPIEPLEDNDNQNNPHNIPIVQLGDGVMWDEEEHLWDNEEELLRLENEEREYVTDSDESEEEEVNTRRGVLDIGQEIIDWVTECNISANAANNLLGRLKKFFPHLPTTINVLRKKAHILDAPIRAMGTGQFCYFGIKPMFQVFININRINIAQEQHFRLKVGIDGVPISKSSKANLWPILVMFQGYDTVLPIGVFYGHGKPHKADDYLFEFATELRDLLQNGHTTEGIHITFSIYALVFDAQAKCFVMDIISPTGFHSCPKCTVIGRKVGPRVVFPNLIAPLRTDDSFLNIHDPIHRNAILPPFAIIGLNCISDTCIDYMHNVLQGVFKTLLGYWVKTKTKPFSLSQSRKNEMNRRIAMFRNQITTDFVRKPRELDDLSFYKATELRLMLLYTGPFIFYNVIKEQYYQHYLLLHCAIRILCHPEHHRTKNVIAKDYLFRFVNDFKFLYGDELLIYNMHLLIHLYNECLHFEAPLDNFSAFPFENFLQKIVKMIKCAPLPLHQLRNRTQESIQYNPQRFASNFKRASKTKKLASSPGYYAKIVSEKKINFSIESPDCFVYYNKCIFKISKIKKSEGLFVLECKKLNELYCLEKYPMESAEFGVYCCNELKISHESCYILASEASKAMCLKLDEAFFFVSILHSE